MKWIILILFFAILCDVCVSQQRKYIDINIISDSHDKSNWANNGDPLFSDEFDGPTMSIDYATGTGGSGCDDEGFKVVKSDQQWRWKWDTYSRVHDGHYDRLGNNYAFAFPLLNSYIYILNYKPLC